MGVLDSTAVDGGRGPAVEVPVAEERTAPQLKELGLLASAGDFKRGRGRPACDNTGFRGRVGLFEVMPLTAGSKALITRRATEAELRCAAAQQGVRTLLECGADAVAAGLTTAEDVLHVAQREERGAGLEVCARLREDLRTAFVPVPMLTMNNDEATRTKGFPAGTDDFMAKPFSVPQLVARVRRLLRRTYGVG